MEWTWKQILRQMTMRNPVKKTKEGKETFKSNEPLPQNIYEITATHKQHAIKFHWIHFVFKYKFFQPVVMIFEKILGKYICYKPANLWHNKNILAFDDAFDVSLREWYKKYIANAGDGKTEKKLIEKGGEKALDKLISNSYSAKTLMSLKHIMVTVLLYDNAYKEFMNILMFNITKGMNSIYKDHKDVKHLLYLHNNPFNVHYFLLGQILQNDKGKMPKKDKDGKPIPEKVKVAFRDA